MTMAAAFALGAEGVQMGTQIVATKNPGATIETAIVNAAETDTIFLNEQFSRRYEHCEPVALSDFRRPTTTSSVSLGTQSLYFGGDMEAAIALSGPVAGRIDEVRSVSDIIASTINEFTATVATLLRNHSPRYCVHDEARMR